MNQPGPVDDRTRRRADHVISQALRDGRDLVETLNRAGLLLTPEQSKKIRVETMEFLRREMGQWRPAEFIRRLNKGLVDTSPDELYRCILEWVDDHVAVAKGEQRD